ncbi:MAG TPA: hypothetical protein DD734_03575 [Firmicutes bacterium]|nr:hypothetical protein [Bacillota bacterium]HBR33688.1 hypothetical protein [Bacillota bacterium]
MPWFRFTVRFVTVSLVVFGLGRILPQFALLPVSTGVLFGLAIAVLALFIETFILKEEVLPFTHGLISFFLSLFGLFFLKTGYAPDISWLGMILAALIIGLVDLIIPVTLT